MHVLHTIASIRKDSGGPSYMVTALCTALAEKGIRVSLAIADETSDDADLVEIENSKVEIVRLPSSGAQDSLQKFIQREKVDLIHTHGLWMGVNRTSSQAAKRYGIPLVWTTHGMLRPWALNHKRWKKKLAMLLYQAKDLASATVLHATCEEEAMEIQQLDQQAKTAVVPIGIDIPFETSPLVHESANRVILFMGRLHPVKGLINLVEAIHIMRPEGWICILAGPDTDSYRTTLEHKISELGLWDWFEFAGEVSGKDKEKLYRMASVFVLPSFTENFGVVVPEALSFSVPVIATDATPWRSLPDEGCGWSVPVGVDGLVAAFREATNMQPDSRYEMGCKGREYVTRVFSWPQIADRMGELYASVC